MLLSAKAVLLTSLVVLWPTIVEAVGAVAYHVSFLQVIEVAVQSALYKAMWLVIGAVFAALTRSVARFVMAVGATLLLLAASLAIAMAVLIATMESDVEATPSRQTFDDPTGGVVALVLGLGAGATLLLVQYRTRSSFKAVATGIVAFAASILVGMAWPWPVLAPRVDDARWAQTSERGRLTASAESVKTSRNAVGTAAKPMWREVSARLQVEDLEPGWSIYVTLQEAVLRMAGGREVAGAAFGAWLTPGVAGGRTPGSEATRAVLEVNRLVVRSTASDSQTVLYLRDAEFRRFAPTSGTYAGLFEVIPTRHEVEGVIRLDVGATHQHGAYRAVIERMTYAPGAALVELRESSAWTIFERRLQPERTYYLRNTARSQAIEGSVEQSSSGWGLPLGFGFHATGNAAWSGFGARRLKVEFPHLMASTNERRCRLTTIGWRAPNW